MLFSLLQKLQLQYRLPPARPGVGDSPHAAPVVLRPPLPVHNKDRNTSNFIPRCENKAIFTAWAVIWQHSCDELLGDQGYYFWKIIFQNFFLGEVKNSLFTMLCNTKHAKNTFK